MHDEHGDQQIEPISFDEDIPVSETIPNADYRVMADLVLTVILILILSYVIFDDLRHFRIRNSVVIVLVAVWFGWIVVMQDLARLYAHLTFALIAFVLLFLAFRKNLIGGGDTKILTAAFLWTGPYLALLFSIFLFGLVVVYWAGAKLEWLPYRCCGGRMKVPFGPSIAGAWIMTVLASKAL